MNILLVMIPLSLLLLAAAVWAFVWAVRRGQVEELDTPAIDILREDPHERSQRLDRAARAGGDTREGEVDGDAPGHDSAGGRD